MSEKRVKEIVDEILQSLDFQRFLTEWAKELIENKYPPFTEIQQPKGGQRDLYMPVDGGEGHRCSCGELVINFSFGLSEDSRKYKKVRFHTRQDGLQSNHFRVGESYGGLFHIDDEDNDNEVSANCLRFNFCPKCHKVLPQVEKP